MSGIPIWNRSNLIGVAMRLRVYVRTAARELPWAEVQRPGRGLCYTLLRESDPALAGRIHERGWGRHRMAPFGYSPPIFPNAPRLPGRYSLGGGPGYLELGSPLVSVVEGWAKALAGRPILDWGGTALHVRNVELVDPPEFEEGAAVMRTVTPVVMKGSGLDENGDRTTRQAWVLPGEPEFAGFLAQNLRRKAETLGLDPDVSLERIVWAGAKRSIDVEKGKKIGAPIGVELRGSPDALGAIWSWGLGQATSAGFGWVAP
jgi:CRISPR-associated endoribonuclease Cas6